MKKTIVIGIIATFFLLLAVTCVSATWYDTDFSYRKQITITHANTLGNTLTNYPALINVSKEPSMQSDFDDIRFIDNSGNLMSFELENYTASYGLYWVNITSLPNTGQTIWIYYGNDTATSATNPTAVWDISAKMVQHLNNMNDSTSYDNDAVNNNADYTASGKIDGAYDFDGSTSYLNCGNDPSLNITDAITIEAWVKANSFNIWNLIVQRGGLTTDKGYYLSINNGNLKAVVNDGTNKIYTNSVSLSLDTWYHIAFVADLVDTDEELLYVNGIGNTPVNISAVGDIGNSLNTYISSAISGNFFNGTIDEVRIYNRALSAEEINQSYQLSTNQSTYVTWGSAEDQNYIPPTPINLVNTTSNFWVNHTWTAGSGYVTDSYNVTVNGTWYNTTNTYYNNTPLYGHAWSNISIFAFNSSGDGSLSASSISQNTQIPNNAPIITNTSDWQGDEGELVYLDFDYTDLDSDTSTFSTNATKGSLNPTTGVFEWYTGMGDQGTYHWNFTINDGWGGEDSYVATVTVGDLDYPIITTWYNNYTYDNLTTFTIPKEDNRTVFFNVTANQTIDYWIWYVDDEPYQNSSVNNVTYTWDFGGNKTVSVYGVNVNGQTGTLTWNIEIEYTDLEFIYLQNQQLIRENEMIGTSIIFGILVAIALLFLVIAIFGIGGEHYFDVLSAFISPTILMLLGFQCYSLEALQEFEFLGLLLVVVAVIIYIYGIILIISIAMNEFGWQDREEDRSPDYEYK